MYIVPDDAWRGIDEAKLIEKEMVIRSKAVVERQESLLLMMSGMMIDTAAARFIVIEALWFTVRKYSKARSYFISSN